MQSLGAWNLVADIGGTNARFGLENVSNGQLEEVRNYPVAAHPDFMAVLALFLSDIAALKSWQALPVRTCLAVACPADQDEISFTNSPWCFTRVQINNYLTKSPVVIINDFAAVAYGVSNLNPQDWRQLGGGEAEPDRPILVLGPGTGLGVGTLLPSADRWLVIEGEGGHVDFAPVGDIETAVLNKLRLDFGRVSVERLLSGDGLVNIYQALAAITHVPFSETVQQIQAADITAAALAGNDALATQTLDLFCRVLGSVAGNLGLSLGAKGGVYIAGGIVPRILEYFFNSAFRERFEAKGRFKDYLGKIPVRVVLKEHLGLSGAMQKLRVKVE